MKIEDLPKIKPLPLNEHEAIIEVAGYLTWAGTYKDRADALSKYLQLAKELLSEPNDNKRSFKEWNAECIEFLAKLGSEGL